MAGKIQVKNILLPIDLSHVSNLIIEEGKQLAKAFNANLWLIHVVAPEPDFVGYKLAPEYERKQRADRLRKEHRLLQEYSGLLQNAGINTTALLVQGPTVEIILDQARKLNAELIILGSRGHGVLFRTVLGSTVEGVIHGSKVPILIVPINSPKRKKLD